MATWNGWSTAWPVPRRPLRLPSSPAIPKSSRAARRINCLSIPPGSAPFGGYSLGHNRSLPATSCWSAARWRPQRHHSQPPRTAGSGRRAGQRLCGADAAYSDAARCSRHQSATRCDPRRVNAVAHEFAAASGAAMSYMNKAAGERDRARECANC